MNYTEETSLRLHMTSLQPIQLYHIYDLLYYLHLRRVIIIRNMFKKKCYVGSGKN